jgi:subfamily B ATP-binding cassette protein MsbA
MNIFHAYFSHYLFRLYKEYLSPYKIHLIIVSILMAVVSGCNGVMVLVIGPIIDKLFISHDPQYLITIPIIIILVTLAKGVAEYFQNYLLKNVGQRLVSNMQVTMYKNFINSDLKTIQEYSSGKVISKFTNDIILMRGALLKFFEGISKHLMSVIVFVSIMFYTEPYISLILFLIFPLAIYPIHLLGIKIEKSVSAAQKELENFTSNIQETLDSSLEVKSYLGEESEIKRMSNVIETIFIHYQNSIKFDSMSSPIIETLGGILLAIIIIYGSIMTFESESTPGSIYSFMAAFSAAYRPFKSITALNIYFREGVSASKRIFALLDINKNLDKKNPVINLESEIKTLEIKNVSLTIGEKTIINNISFDIKGPKNIAIIGESGSGKTTLANMIAGFCNPSSGEILINDQSINLYSHNSLRKHIAYVTQNPKLFNITIKENISYPNLTDEITKVIRASKLAFADQFVLNLRGQYDYLVRNSGNKFSAGQLQRISIARSLYKDSYLMIFDEATNSLDQNTEKMIRDGIIASNTKKINIFITHRINDLNNFDQIIVMKDGKIIESGTPKELIQNKGEYFHLLKINS